MKTIVLFLSLMLTLSVAASPSYSITENTVSVFMDDSGIDQEVAHVDLNTGDVYSFTKDYDISATVLMYETDYSIAIQTKTVDYAYLYITEKYKMTDVIRELYHKSESLKNTKSLHNYNGLLIEGDTRI